LWSHALTFGQSFRGTVQSTPVAARGDPSQKQQSTACSTSVSATPFASTSTSRSASLSATGLLG
jgi:hypothetical protein